MWVGAGFLAIGLAISAALAASAWWRVRYWHVSQTPTTTGIGVPRVVWAWVVTSGVVGFDSLDAFPWVDRSWEIEPVKPGGYFLWTLDDRPGYTNYAGLALWAKPGASGGMIALWPVAAIPLAIGGATLTLGWRTRLRVKRLGLCEKCGYARAGISSKAPCPECGHVPAAKS